MIMLFAIMIYPNSLWSVAVPAFLASYGIGVLYAELMACVLAHVVAYNGLASSLAGTSRFVFAACVGFLLGLVFDQSALPLAIAMFLMSASTGLIMWHYFRLAALKGSSWGQVN